MESPITKNLVLTKTIEFLQNHSFRDYPQLANIADALSDENNQMITDKREAEKLLNSFDKSKENGYGYAIEFLKTLIVFPYNNLSSDAARIKTLLQFANISFYDPVKVVNVLLGVTGSLLFIWYGNNDLKLLPNDEVTLLV